jgi:hypothetical protein
VDEQVNCLFPQKKEDRSQLEIPFQNPKQGYVKKDLHPNPDLAMCKFIVRSSIFTIIMMKIWVRKIS